ncbi:MAG: SdiA-regulated domain-containing protein [Elusimicrobiota bacterium]
MNTKQKLIRMMQSSFPALLFGLLIMMTTRVFAGDPIYVYDSNNNGSEVVTLSGAQSGDPDGAIIDYQWKVNNVTVSSGYGPKIPNLQFTFNLGTTGVSLVVRDDVQVSSTDVANVIVLPPSSNSPPVANAIVPSVVMANAVNVASVTVNASASTDADGDLITRYRWTEGATTYYDGASPTATLVVSGLGLHNIRLTVYSTDNLNITQAGFRDFSVTLDPLSVMLAGRTFNRTVGKDFNFGNPAFGNYAGITFNPLSQTYYVTENNQDKVFEIQQDATLIRIIDIGGLKAAGIPTADAEGIAWMSGTKYAIALHDGKEMAIVNIVSTTTALSRPEATIYDISSGPGKPKGLAYAGWENAFYWVAKDTPKAVIKSQINPITGALETLWSKLVDNLPVSDLSDVATFPRISSSLILVSESSRTVMEADLTGPTAVLKSSFSLSGWNIPQASGLTFNQDGNLIIVGKSVANTPEDDFNVFVGTAPIANKKPNPLITSGL